MTTSELQVFGALNPQLPMKTCSAAMHPGKVNLVVGRPVKVSSDCFRNARHKKFLTDGDTRKGRHGNDHYWHSCNQRHKWAQVDFPETCVRKITIWSRPNCCPNQMQNVVAHIWSQGRWVRCGAASPNIGKKSAPYSFDCAMVGSKVRISRNEGSWMSISELEVFGPSLEPVCDVSMSVDKRKNLALKAPVRVSSDCYRNARHKKFMVDGDRRVGKRGNDHYWHSCNQRNKWAEVTIPEQCVRQVQIWSRPNCCSNQMQGVVAHVLSDGKWKRCGGVSPNVNKLAAPYAFDCGIVGSKVRVTRNHHTWMTIGELEVFGPGQKPSCDVGMGVNKGKNLALKAPVRVSSDCYRNARHRKFMVDGDRRVGKRGNDHYWHSCNQRNKWAEVTIPEQCVRQVQIWSRPNCCSNQMQGVVAHVFSDGKWKRCGGVSPNVNKLAAPYAFDCGIVGSKVRVTRNHHTWFTIGELEVFGPQVGPVEPKCDGSMSISKKNLALGKKAKVSSECYKRNPTNKGYLTDGDNRVRGRRDRKYWHSCAERNPNAVVEFPSQCVREVKIWSRADCCSGQMQGVMAEIWSGGQWKRCGGISNNVGRKRAYSFKCSIVGTQARIIKKTNRGWITTSEMEVFGAEVEPKCDTSMAVDRKNLARGKRAKVSSECYKRNPTNKGYLTDGDNRVRGRRDRKYWHSCAERNPHAQVEVGKKCIREVKIWSRADCCSHQMQGVTAEVYSHGKWKRCGGISNNVGRKKAYTFKCAIVGTHARIIKRTNRGWITTSEMEVFAAKWEPGEVNTRRKPATRNKKAVSRCHVSSWFNNYLRFMWFIVALRGAPDVWIFV